MTAKVTMMRALDNGKEADIYLEEIIYKLFKSELEGQSSATIEDAVLKYLSGKQYPVPTSFGLFKNTNRFGVKMSYEHGPTLQDDFYKTGHGARAGTILGHLHSRLHNIDNENLPSNLPYVNDLLIKYAIKNGLTDLLASLMNGKYVLAHGDFHPANVIETSGGPVVIDWSRSFIGPPEADIACTLVILDLFQPPADANIEESATAKKNVIEFKSAYLNEYNQRVNLDLTRVEQWKDLVASRIR